jgi:hypothetical protein
MKTVLLGASALFMVQGAAYAQTRTVDQSAPATNSATGAGQTAISVPVDRYGSFGQSFTPSLNSIDFATFYLENQYGSQIVPGSGAPNVNAQAVPALYSASLYKGYGTYNANTLLGTTNTTLIPASYGLDNPFFNAEFDFAASIALTAGQQYTLILNDLTHAATPTLFDDVSVQVSTYNYPGGNFTVAGPGNSDLVFSEGVFSAASGVPEPASWGMMILGMAVVGGFMRSRVRASEAKFDIKITRIAAGEGAA